MAEYTLQLLHASDLEGGVEAIANAPNFAAIVDFLEDKYENTVVISAGDNYIPGPFFSAAGDDSLTAIFQQTYEDFYDLPAGSLAGLEEGVGRVDISIMNFIGFDASAIGNHEFDLGPDAFESLIAPAVDDSDDDGAFDTIEWLGTQFPYLAANLDFSMSGWAGLVVEAIQPNTAFQSLPPFDPAVVADTPKLAPATVIERGGESIGVVGVTTPLLQEITSPGAVEVVGHTSNDMVALAAIVQPAIDALLAQGINKIILTTHLQQIALEQELLPLLAGVDIVIAGGSDTLLADETDVLRLGDEAADPYPLILSNADGDPAVIVSTAGEYTYVGRLVANFDADGVLLPDSIEAAVSGQYATTDEQVSNLYGNFDAAFADETRGELVLALTNAVAEVVNAQDSNVFGLTEVFLEGRREAVRTEETNLGNLTADANLFYSQFYDVDVQVSIKNGGGIRAPIGEVGDGGELLPPQTNPASGKNEGEISQLDIDNTLRFNNELSLLTVTAAELETILEYAVSATAPGATPGQFPQVGGIAFSFDPTATAIELDDTGAVVTTGDRVQSLAILGENDTIADIIVEAGELVGDPDREIRLVTLNFLASGGDGYPFDLLGENRVDLPAQPLPTGAPNAAIFTEPGTEQDALAEYLAANFPADTDPATPAFMMADTSLAEDVRIQNLSAREDSVLMSDDGEPTPPPTESPEFPEFANGFEGPFSRIGSVELEAGAEINAYDAESQKLFVVSGEPILQIVDLSDPTNPINLPPIDVSDLGAGINSVAVQNGLVAIAIASDPATDNGLVAFLDTNGTVLQTVTVGPLPDMLTFTPDASKVLVANEGEPNEDYSIDPEGSISIIDLSNGIENASVTTADFTVFNDRRAELQASGVKLFGLNATVAEDLEPEYIAVSPEGSTAWVTLQENNAVAAVDITAGNVVDILPLGVKDFSQEAQLDASNEDGGINLQNWPVFGLYQPDAIASYESNGATYYVTANEGDARIRPDGDLENDAGNVILEEGAVFNEEVRIAEVELDPTAFPNATELQQEENLGRLKITNALGDLDGDGDFDQLFAFGGRSFSIWDEAGNRVYDSSDDIAKITATLTPQLFNANDGDPAEFDDRSDDKGAEPEALTIGQIGDTIYAFVGLERAGGGVLIYDITDPLAPTFVQYVRSDEDIAPEGLTFISASDSPNGNNLLVVTNEESSTVAVYEFDPEQVDAAEVVLDFEGFAAGTVVTDQFAGVSVATSTPFGAMLFDTANVTGSDDDLAADDLGQVLILSEDGDSTDPDDAARGGTFSLDFDELVTVASISLLDIEEADGLITFFGADDRAISSFEIEPLGNNSLQQIRLGVEGVSQIEVFLAGSGAIADLVYSAFTKTVAAIPDLAS